MKGANELCADNLVFYGNDECKKASRELGKPYRGYITNYDYPKCFYSLKDHFDGVFWNRAHNGAANQLARPICRSKSK